MQGGTHLENEIVMLEFLHFLCFDVQCKSEVTFQTWNFCIISDPFISVTKYTSNTK